MESLIKIIENYYDRKIISEELSSDEQEELEYLKSFIKSFNINDIRSILGFDQMKYFICSLAASSEDRNFGLLKEKAEKIPKSFLNNCDYTEIGYLNNKIADFILNRNFRFLERLPFLDNYHDESLDIIKKLKEKGLLEDAIEVHKILKRYISTEEQRQFFFSIFKEHSANLLLALNSIATLNGTAQKLNFKREDTKIPQSNDGIPSYRPLTISTTPSFDSFDYSGKDTKKALRKLLEACYVVRFNTAIIERISFLEKLPSQRYKENSNNRRKKDKLISQIRSFDISKIIEPSRSFLESMSDEKIKYFILKEILLHNATFHQETKLDLLKESQLSSLERIFKKSCFSIDSLTLEQKDNLLTYGNISDIEKMLTILTDSDLKFTNEFSLYDVLLLSNPHIIMTILKLRAADMISESLIMSSKEIFVEDINEELRDKTTIKEGKFNTLINNVNTLSNLGLPTDTISKKEKELLLMDSNRLNESLRLIELYNLDYNSYELIKDNDLISVVDRFIELGLYDYIKSHPRQISNNSLPRLDRIKLCKLLNIQIMEDGKLSSRITSKEFTIGKNTILDTDLNEFIPNSVNRYLNEECFKVLVGNKNYTDICEEIDLIKEYATSEVEYNFGGIIISRNKVLRNYKCLIDNCSNIDNKTLLLNAIIFGSTLDDEQIDIINDIINKKAVQKELK